MNDFAKGPSPAARVVVIGGSAGGLAPLRIIVAALPADFAAAVLVVIHIAATRESALPQILSRASALEARHAVDGELILPGEILVAAPDEQILVDHGQIRITHGPAVHGHRPAVDPLLLSAASDFGPACCGVILSGMLTDGAAGLLEVKRRGGTTMVQDPEDAMHPGMPTHAMEATTVDEILPARGIGEALVRFASTGVTRAPAVPPAGGRP
jgi:two-component system chemotaxis response regulator CheB